MGDEDRVVSAAEGNTVTICILSPVTTLDERDVDPTTSGHSSTLCPSRFDRLVTHGLVEVGSETSCGWEGSEKTSGVDALRGHPIMGSKLYSAGRPTMQESWQAVGLEGNGTAQELWESQVVGPKA